MIYNQTLVKVADNSGARIAKCIRTYNCSNKRGANVGDIILVSIKKTVSDKKVKKGQMYKAVVVRSRRSFFNVNGTITKFNENAVVLLNETLQPVGTRVFGILLKELKYKNFLKVLSLGYTIL